MMIQFGWQSRFGWDRRLLELPSHAYLSCLAYRCLFLSPFFFGSAELNFDDASSDDTAERAEGTAGAAVVSDPDEVLVVKEADQDIFGGD